MNKSRLLYVGIALIVIGLVSGFKILIIILGALLLISSLFIYSTRKSRVRYWLQSYKHIIDKEDLSNESAILKLRDQFCKSKHFTADICSKKFITIDEFVVEVIQSEFKFDIMLKGKDVLWGLKKYTILKEKLNKEIEEVKEELGL